MSSYNATVELFSKLCFSQLNQPLSALDAANDGLGATLVPRPRSCALAVNCLTTCLQAVMYAVSAAVSAFFFASWKRLDDDSKSRVWRRYGWFSALAFVGSVGGLVTAAADIRYRYHFQRYAYWYKDTNGVCSFEKGFSNAIECFKVEAVNGALSSKWLAVSPVPYAIEFLCLCCANLLVRAHARLPPQSRRTVLQLQLNRDQVVERMADFVGRQFVSRWFKLLPHAVIVSVTILNATNIVFMAVFSYFASQSLLPKPLYLHCVDSCSFRRIVFFQNCRQT